MTEMRAKRMIDKLNLMSRELVTVIRDGEKMRFHQKSLFWVI